MIQIQFELSSYLISVYHYFAALYEILKILLFNTLGMRHFRILITLLCLTLCNSNFAQINEIIETLEIDTLMNNGSKDNRINFAFANMTHAEVAPYASKEELRNDIEDI